ncbi:MAG: nitrilase-related carbon-nitrogen hydrolase, partial [Thermodesulfobacteriota bacterium]|nr:nitrilase-related carbon-nitrogen hydrolase [Thermodesulfobacteriota bacterium]
KTGHNLDQIARWIKIAKNQGASIICFPEMNITGYSVSADISDDAVGAGLKPAPTGYSVSADISDAAEPVPGPATDKLLNLASEKNIVILAGMAEKDDKGRIFANHLIVKPHEDLGVYRKLYIAPPERPIYTPGNKIPLFETQGVKFGIQLCYDAHFPELSTHMAMNGADIIFMPHASPRGTPDEKFKSWMRHLPARAYDNSLFVIACNQTGNNKKGLSFPGVSLIIDPSGNIIKKNATGEESIIVADLKADDLSRVRNNRMSFFLPNKRADLYNSL